MDAPDRYAVIGHPVEHSKSPEIHAYFAQQTGQALTYERLLAPLDGFAHTVQIFRQQGGKGANVTVPFKLEAYAVATKLTERAQAAGAVNTLHFLGDDIVGDNTDGVGLVTDIVRNAAMAMNRKRVLLLGAGGAARGVMLPVLEQRPAEVVIANRTLAKAGELAQQFGRYGTVKASNFDSLQEPFDIIINATSASLAGEAIPISPVVFGHNTFAYDMMYGKEPTAFMRHATQYGARVRDGLGMLIEQAAEAFFVWRGVRPDTGPLFAQLRTSFQ